MINLPTAFATAWKDLKAMATKVSAALAKEAPAISSVVAEASTVAVIVDPSAAPVVTALDSLEEVIIGRVAAFASDVANANSCSQIFGEIWPTVQSVVGTLKSHPTVASVTAALAPKAA